MIQLENYRQEFPALANKNYFNYGGQGTLPKIAMNTISQAQEYIQSTGPFGSEAKTWIDSERKALRIAVASELNVTENTVTITENVTMGCNIIMWGIDWQAGDHLLISDCEHPGVVAISQEISHRFKVDINTCSLIPTLNNDNAVTIIQQNLRPNTRLLVLSHVLWNTGQLLPINEIADICNINKTLLLVDAAQSMGMLPLDLHSSGVDFYAFTGHKWLCGPEGIGGLYIKAESGERLRPTFIGWRSIIANFQEEPISWQKDGQRYEVATSSYSLYPGLREAINIHKQWGTSTERYHQICANSEYLWYRLAEIPQVQCLRTTPPESGLVSFQISHSKTYTSSQLVRFLESECKVFCRYIIKPNSIRACVHYFTSKSEVDKLIEGVIGWIERERKS
ncbi:Cysteine desulfurase [Richelia intracellularis HH01]|uniref:Cysteine desulfurase n=1 Tax=Richelia intracellularis HH01 TaxID=1165094 RepID=M1WZJ1_9NOST|nr:aminotransferase class V-fold PLP-dependent enzyme [Richelia intracellularis]CCH66853.1 Cysteine desulfurase [Richelia intracellularis HH01]